jgi:hypothetical protein
MGRQRPARDWISRAHDTRLQIDAAKHGDKEAQLRRLAGEEDINTLRRHIVALSFLDELKGRDPSLWQKLQWLPFSTIEVFARWNSFDSEGAMATAIDVIRGGRSSSRHLTDLLQQAKLRAAPERPHHERIAPAVKRGVEELLGGTITEVAPQSKVRSDTTYSLSREIHEKPEMVALLTIGPYQNPQLYHKRMTDWILRAFGFSWTAEHVVLLLPRRTELEPYRLATHDMLRRIRDRPIAPSVHVICVE